MVSIEIRELWEKNNRNEKISMVLECYRNSKNMSELPLRIAAISVAVDISEDIKKDIISLVISEYTNPAIVSKTIYESAFVGNDYLFGLLFEKGFITENTLHSWVHQEYNLSALVPVLNIINKNFNSKQNVERLTNYLLSLFGQKEKQELFEKLLRDFWVSRNLFIIRFLISMYGVKVPEFIDTSDRNENGYLPYLDKSDTFAYLVNSYKNLKTDKERDVYDDLLMLLFNHGMQPNTTLRYTNMDGTWNFEDISYYIEHDIRDTTISKLYLKENQGLKNKVYLSVYYFYYYDFSLNINDLADFKYYAVKDVIEYSRQNNIYVLSTEIDNEKMTIKYSCDDSVNIDSLTQDMRNELCCGNYYQILFPSAFSKASNIWISNVYTEENTITTEMLSVFKRNQRQEKFPKK